VTACRACVPASIAVDLRARRRVVAACRARASMSGRGARRSPNGTDLRGRASARRCLRRSRGARGAAQRSTSRSTTSSSVGTAGRTTTTTSGCCVGGVITRGATAHNATRRVMAVQRRGASGTLVGAIPNARAQPVFLVYGIGLRFPGPRIRSMGSLAPSGALRSGHIPGAKHRSKTAVKGAWNAGTGTEARRSAAQSPGARREAEPLDRSGRAQAEGLAMAGPLAGPARDGPADARGAGRGVRDDLSPRF
jgi:hypothetical protein